MTTPDKLRDRLQAALENLLTALVLAGVDLEADVPYDAIDTALGNDPNVQTARQSLHVALRGLQRTEAGDGHHQAVLALEEAANALVVASADVACRLGFKVASHRSSRSSPE